MIRKTEAGNYVNFQAFGREIYRQVEQQDGPSAPMYARKEQPHFKRLEVKTANLDPQIQYTHPNMPATPQPMLNGGKPNMFAKYVEQSTKMYEHNEQ